jgi:hypothetical protein
VDLAGIQERGVRAEPEGEFPELEVFQVHAALGEWLLYGTTGKRKL